MGCWGKKLVIIALYKDQNDCIGELKDKLMYGM